MASNLDVGRTENGHPLKRYRPEDVELALRVLALNGGNVLRTQRQLHAEGITVSEGILYHWSRESFPNRYAEIQDEYASSIAKRMAGRAIEIAEKAMDGERLLVDRTLDQVDEIPARDLAQSARNLSQVKATSIDKALLLRGQPTTISKDESLDELVDMLEELLGTTTSVDQDR